MSKSIKTNRSKNQRRLRSTRVPHTVGNKTEPPILPRQRPKSSATPAARSDSKLSNMIALMRLRQGATIEQLAKATGWQAHSVRGAMSGAIKKKMGLIIASSKVDGVRTYRIVPAGSA